jgi:hypothetical protein
VSRRPATVGRKTVREQIARRREVIAALLRAPPGVFNQYCQVDPDLDRPDGAERRLANLGRYLELFGAARYLLVGEAVGFKAGRFSGVPFTDEARLVGPAPLAWAQAAGGFQRSSREDQPLRREASAGLVWRALGERRDVALWNVVPWHPAGRRGPLSNALPNRAAQRAGLEVLSLMLAAVWPAAQPLAVGRLAERALRELGCDPPVYLRHPAHGGGAAFQAGFAQHCPRNPGPASPR